MQLGPCELIVVAFPGNEFTGDVAPALAGLVERGTIRVLDLLFVTKDASGEVGAFELADVDDAVRAGYESLLDDPLGLLTEEDVEDVAESLDPESSAAILLFEHAWAAPLRDAVVASGGELVGSVRIPPDVIEEAHAAVAST